MLLHVHQMSWVRSNSQTSTRPMGKEHCNTHTAEKRLWCKFPVKLEIQHGSILAEQNIPHPTETWPDPATASCVWAQPSRWLCACTSSCVCSCPKSTATRVCDASIVFCSFLVCVLIYFCSCPWLEALHHEKRFLSWALYVLLFKHHFLFLSRKCLACFVFLLVFDLKLCTMK